MSPKISVIMPIYNTPEEWLRKAIESILNQTFTDFEFIIINDGSTNNAESVILSYKDPRIIYIKQENQGIAKTLNNGLSVAQGEYIARMDSDDISLPNRFEKQVEFLEKNQAISICGTNVEVFPVYNLYIYPEKPTYCDFLNWCAIGHPTVMFRKHDFDKYNLRYNSEYLCEDYELWSRAVRTLNFSNLQEILLKYRCHDNNLSQLNESFSLAVQKVQQNMLDFLTNDKELQNKIKDLILQKKNKTVTFWQKIFSIKNEYSLYNKKHKVIRILGLKISLKSNTL